ncbi:MAG: cell division protein ZapD [Pseudomonadota bacterium]|nr:cell division protein ZapD [Pseudomonadota bacterium]
MSDTLTPEQTVLLHPVTTTIIYEQPLNERIRNFLRLEFLFAQSDQHLRDNSQWGSRCTLASLLDILSIFGRTDLKTEVLKELERHSSTLNKLKQNPGVDSGRLEQILSDLKKLGAQLHKIGGPIGADLKDNEFLSSIQQRTAIPGGTCDFDLPAYHYWLQQPTEKRNRDLADWLGRFTNIGQAIQLILQLVRDSTILKPVTAESGFFQKTLDSNHPCQLVRVEVDKNIPCYAEISGGRHRFTVRFLELSREEGRLKQTSDNIDFKLGSCVI